MAAVVLVVAIVILVLVIVLLAKQRQKTVTVTGEYVAVCYKYRIDTWLEGFNLLKHPWKC